MIAPAARLTGGALYGGPAALLAGLANVIVEAENGSDIGASLIAKLTGKDSSPATAEARPTDEIPLDKVTQAPLATQALTSANSAITPATDHRSSAVPGLQSAKTEGTMTPEAIAAYARASALTAPKPGRGAVDWTNGVITPSPAGSGAGIPSVSQGVWMPSYAAVRRRMPRGDAARPCRLWSSPA